MNPKSEVVMSAGNCSRGACESKASGATIAARCVDERFVTAGGAEHKAAIKSRLAAFWLALFACLSGGTLVGCNPPPRPEFREISRAAPGTVPSDQPLEEPSEAFPDLAPAQRRFSEPWETWQSYHIAGQHVGYSHVRAEPQSDEPDSPIQITLQDQVMLRRGPSSIVQRLDQVSLETPEGELISFDAQLRVGPAVTKFAGTVEGDSLRIVTTRGSKKSSQKIPWQRSYRGLVGLQQSLMSDPLSPGEQRRLRTLMPIQFAIAKIDLNCGHVASIAMPDGRVEQAHEIEVAMHVGDGQAMETLVWTDTSGKVLKSYTPALDLVAYDSTQQDATANIVASEDILMATAVEVSGELTKPDQASRVGYLVVPRTSQQDRPSAAVFQGQPGQWVRQTAEGAYQLLVSRDPQESAGEGFVTANPPPGPEDSRSGPLINSNDPLVKQLAATATGRKNQPVRLALDLARTAKTLVRRTDYAQGFRPASEVARDGSGDCTAHAVLLAAMLRSRGIPARVAVGLVYVPTPEQPRMVYHMWTLAHLEGDWVHLDATLTGGYAAADRITLGTHHLADGNEYECVVPIIGAIGRFDIEIIKATYQPLD